MRMAFGVIYLGKISSLLLPFSNFSHKSLILLKIAQLKDVSFYLVDKLRSQKAFILNLDKPKPSKTKLKKLLIMAISF